MSGLWKALAVIAIVLGICFVVSELGIWVILAILLKS